ncbi:MAG: hypothetical protein M1123_03210, partial [Candidatus Thermoplasmatota archaeon]|nr:hypothetical protein [Candidatus Thermoplasmatota archaeon]
MRNAVKVATIGIALLVASMALFATTTVVNAQGPSSGPIGVGNLTAKVIAYSGEVITGQVDATGYT